MDIRTFYLSLTIDQRDDMARSCGTTPGHLRNVAYGRQPGETLTMDIDRFTNGVVSCEELRPDLADRWAYLRATPPELRQPIDRRQTPA